PTRSHKWSRPAPTSSPTRTSCPPTLMTDGRKGIEIHALALPGGALERELAKLTRTADRFVFWTMAWQAEGVTDPSVRAVDHPDRFEVVLSQAGERETAR